MYQKKTARYTFSLPFVTACILTEQDETTQLAMSELGEALGCIFQLRDDELTLIGKEEVVGKTIGNDIIENKKTYATTLLWELVTPEEKKQLEHIFGNSSIETKDIIYVQSLFSKYDIHTLILTRMMNYEKIADTTITTLNLPDIKKDELRGITHYLATREK
jgi:geranylgeranyl pyrophosphate synthase